MTRVLDRLEEVMVPGEWYTTMELTKAIGTNNSNVYKTLKKAVLYGIVEKGPNRVLPWGEAATWRLKPPRSESRSRKPLIPNPLRRPHSRIISVIHLYTECITTIAMTVRRGSLADSYGPYWRSMT